MSGTTQLPLGLLGTKQVPQTLSPKDQVTIAVIRNCPFGWKNTNHKISLFPMSKGTKSSMSTSFPQQLCYMSFP